MASSSPPHPYSPTSLQLPGFVAEVLTLTDILIPFFAGSILVVVVTWLISGRCSKITKVDRVLMCWFAFTGLIHILIEGPFVFTPDFYKKNPPNFFDELWKEYSKGDSRYVARDAATVTIEGITSVLEGPASLLAVYAIGARKPYSYALQLAVCLGQLYGCIVYYATAYLDGFHFWISPFYFWAYFILANSFWVVIPTVILLRSWNKISKAVQLAESKKKTY